MKKAVAVFLEELVANYPVLQSCRGSITAAFDTIAASYRNGGKLLVCGNGGSASDALHIVGELMKGYLKKRPLPEADAARLSRCGLEIRCPAGDAVQGALPAISLVNETSLITAYANDVDASMIFAQQVYGYRCPGDVLLGISTSGNAASVANAVRVAAAFGLATVGLSGGDGGKLVRLCDVCVCVPADRTPRIQELHQPVYHALCAMLEEEFFGG